MTTCASKDRFGYLGTEAAALREHLDQASAAIARAARSEGTEAATAAAEAARELLARAALLADEWVDKAKGAAAAVDAGQEGLADIVRRKPLTALGVATAAGFVLALLMRRK
ncbi:MAG: hypothetical protein EPO10_05235 [Reyranella sp.]|uniref:DUF883 C-terminal domain-containing protein n=1 Tax=Reyranella sp. TaxID=1929291 RepID=UPI001204DC83|nr:DUF883 C-terminal domain-containing protein [Reyranella sp.]TAJ97945.1 MAG: hypothetical protein EPO41_00330 [Reyranella sp.]TBR29960.1 MAG: hypothetical protein EPO10_05235 [Reyranella sp.]